MELRKLTPEQIDRQATAMVDTMEKLKTLQTVVYVMVGGGFLGSQAVEQPHYFYIDGRVSGLPYSKRAIMQAVEVLRKAVDNLGLTDADLKRPEFPNCGTF